MEKPTFVPLAVRQRDLYRRIGDVLNKLQTTGKWKTVDWVQFFENALDDVDCARLDTAAAQIDQLCDKIENVAPTAPLLLPNCQGNLKDAFMRLAQAEAKLR